MESDNPQWQAYDPSSPSPGRVPTLADGVRQVVLLADRECDQSGWGPKAALSIARTWVRRRERVLLADLGLVEPRLHEVVGGPNGEGISDVFLYGSSFQRIARRAGEGLLFAPAGTALADPTLVLESDRWTTIADGFDRAGAILVLYLPDGIDGADSVVERASGVVVLSGGRGGVRTDLGSTPLLAVLGPPGPAAGVAGGAAGAAGGGAAPGRTGAGGTTDGEGRDPAGDVPVEPSVAGPPPGEAGGAPATWGETHPREPQASPSRSPSPARRSATGPVGDPLASAASLDADRDDAAEVEEPPPVRSPRRSQSGTSGRRTLLLLLVLLLVIAGVVLAGLYGLVEVPGISPLGSAGAADAPVAAGFAQPAGPSAGAA